MIYMKRGIMLRQSKSDGAIISLSLCPALMLTGLFFSSSASATDPSSSATATVHVSEACSLASSVITPHTDNMSNGTSTESLGSTKFTVKCNDASGFALYAIGYSGNEYGATSMLGDNELSIPTGTDASAGNTTSHWSMKISKDTTSYLPNSLTIENSFNSQHLIPSTYTKIASFPSSTDGINGTGSSILATYGVRISGAQAAGTYIGKVKYTLVHPNMVNNDNKPVYPLEPEDCLPDSICYAPNSGEVIGSMSVLGVVSASDRAGRQTKVSNEENADSISSNADVVLVAPNYSLPGYGFAGWSTDYEATNSSTIYGPNETITIGDVSEHGMILYPVWIASAGTLQGWTGCGSLSSIPLSGRATLSSMTALRDTRDNNVYTVAKLADGKCWMVENLRLEGDDSRGDLNINRAQGYGDATNSAQGDLGSFIGLADSENANFTSNTGKTSATTANSIYYAGTQSGTATINILQDHYAGYRLPRYNNSNTNRNLTATDSEVDGVTYYQWFGYGNYYNWAAAVADTSYLNQNNDSTSTSICPAGWRLPIGGQVTVVTTGDFYVLTKTLLDGAEPNQSNANGYGYYYGVTDGVDLGVAAGKALTTFPNNFVYSGFFNSDSAENRSSNGFYWCGTIRTRSSGYYLNLNAEYVYPGNNSMSKFYGQSVRCIAQ